MARIISYKKPESSFMTVEKDARLIVDKLQNNNRIVRLLYNTSPEALELLHDEGDITDELREKLITEGYIRLKPKLTVDADVLNYIIVSFDNFLTNGTNPQFRDNIVTFDIICHISQ